MGTADRGGLAEGGSNLECSAWAGARPRVKTSARALRVTPGQGRPRLPFLLLE